MTDRALSFLYTIEQERAQKANELARGDKDYKSAADKFPAMIMSCGLLQALTFYKSKDKELYDALAIWFREKLGMAGDRDLLDYAVSLSVSEYRAATTEALAFLTWLKRFADAKYQEAQRQQRRIEAEAEGM
ncbi:type III-B CRISPR module-associated protein Cmr5 [Candidatus Hakubella thermalkaliphila]|uniref:CRISPR type III-B/RAMP module-associated protein Cmr5 n=1 Tax=Candidatus Hakubella thermalkaliphila TaxID=2754717 RepID=A0A6V8P4U2_9ACTN|nr:type III-B CRISPR module-associated protein Cmr5 [Candidatus Hakubella thermalkaliphila]MBT9168700.1 CRISPR system Cmr subunit Cmr5 [Bacillota bacterium]GFP27357.1 CRISPR-associated protein Cmr5 [Candidatus Hakubella thermalkaliphila]GFP41763.1 CRISPR-associated protein Cmr5 [Candidatus Hakubella thermalkaliphila]